ncbi:hypothetical protein A3E39_02820 [Candidatus Uhrbacteria bacterium RIFCSPHIGHO2_12_FULL_60_25]|uniref:Ribose-5-phosphate isomerase n=1 Tax=Candidatus Uhrbacteria bacterium RIFCSPHIGHO2_12_FULL_60_25 TaxID=1802399 RepID=A0A1F7UL33_9BACT|nr:MAG: hypothetical protein A3D73_00085 [Candidatus Uhrbacteria bacterium RIFCSPHIGHO2_02_FULL_60_44]OGL78407.1 MAG: hypothetical protein A3E39_02820 [Candidatus Uhrbacteria bacterium RIFCSPHIGHO2_12_FULL_60_25]
MKTLYLGADHAGWKLKEKLKPHLTRLGHSVKDLTPMFMPGDDYPWIGTAVAKKAVKDHTRGILVCGSGVGVAIAANRVKGARAVEGHTTSQVKHAREHNDVNVLTLGGWTTSVAAAMKLIKTFLATKTFMAARHRRRVKQLG